MKTVSRNRRHGKTERVFVFGSNLQGRHGRGAARTAYQEHGAIWGQAEGRQGSSYAIPTKISPYETMDLDQIRKGVKRFLMYARFHKELTFIVTAIGTGLAGHSVNDIAPMFKNAPRNCIFFNDWNKDD